MILTRKFMAGLMLLSLMAVLPMRAAELNCHDGAADEDFRYVWRIRGGLSWIAGIMFPTSGVANLKTTYLPGDGEHQITSELLITPASGQSGGFYVYQSEMDEAASKTLVTYHGYAWGKKSRKERTTFDYARRRAVVRKETPEKQWERNDPLPSNQFRDVLTAIHFLRSHASTIHGPITTTIYSDGSEYPVTFQPVASRSFVLAGVNVNSVGFEIVDAPGGKKWPGGIRVFMTDDARRIPLRIEIVESLASLQLDLKTVDGCDFMGKSAS